MAEVFNPFGRRQNVRLTRPKLRDVGQGIGAVLSSALQTSETRDRAAEQQQRHAAQISQQEADRASREIESERGRAADTASAETLAKAGRRTEQSRAIADALDKVRKQFPQLPIAGQMKLARAQVTGADIGAAPEAAAAAQEGLAGAPAPTAGPPLSPQQLTAINGLLARLPPGTDAAAAIKTSLGIDVPRGQFISRGFPPVRPFAPQTSGDRLAGPEFQLKALREEDRSLANDIAQIIGSSGGFAFEALPADQQARVKPLMERRATIRTDMQRLGASAGAARAEPGRRQGVQQGLKLSITERAIFDDLPESQKRDIETNPEKREELRRLVGEGE